MTDYAIGIDIGGTRMKAACVTSNGDRLSESMVPTDSHKGPEILTTVLEDRIEAYIEERGSTPIGIGLGLTGCVDPDRGVVYLPGKFKGLQGLDIVGHLRRRYRIPVWADNDGRLAMIAEKRFGLAKTADSALCITVGTGVGSGVLLNGAILRDRFFLAGTQVGHLVIQSDNGKLCLTKARGTGETLCSATALMTAVRDGLQRGIPSILQDRYAVDPTEVTPKAVFDAVREGDTLAVDELERWTERLGWLIVSGVHAYSPEIVILSGGAVRSGDLFLPRLQEMVDRHTFRFPAQREIPVVASRIVDYAGVLGAAAMIWERIHA